MSCLQILVQPKIQKNLKPKTFAKFHTNILSLKDVLEIMSPIIDNNNYHVVDIISAESRGMKKLSAYSTMHKNRFETCAVVTNGENTIMLNDFDIDTHTVTVHDPIITIVGKEAEEIAQLTVNGIEDKLMTKLMSIRADSEVLEDIAQLHKTKPEELLKILKEVTKEADLTVKERFRNVWKN